MIEIPNIKKGELYFYAEPQAKNKKSLTRNFYIVGLEQKIIWGEYQTYNFCDLLVAIGPVKNNLRHYCFLYIDHLISLGPIDLIYLHEYDENIRNTFLQNYF